MWFVIWLTIWIVVMGLPNYLFKRYKFTYYENAWKHSLFFFLASILVFWVYQNYFYEYFASFSFVHLVCILSLFLFWIFAPYFLYRSDYYDKVERFNYQLPKFFDISFQQLCILGGFLTFGVSPILFGLVFFLVHVPIFILIPKRFMILPVFGSLLGGIIFTYLQSRGVYGLLVALFIHLLFWLTAHYVLSKKLFNMIPLKR